MNQTQAGSQHRLPRRASSWAGGWLGAGEGRHNPCPDAAGFLSSSVCWGAFVVLPSASFLVSVSVRRCIASALPFLLLGQVAVKRGVCVTKETAVVCRELQLYLSSVPLHGSVPSRRDAAPSTQQAAAFWLCLHRRFQTTPG